MDQTAIEKLSARQNLSQWIKNLSRSYRDNFQKASMDLKCIKIYREKKSKGLDRQLVVEIYREAIELDRNNFSKIGKHRNECNQASYLTKDPNNILSFQKHLSTKQCKAFKIQNTHTHTHTLNKSNQFYISKIS